MNGLADRHINKHTDRQNQTNRQRQTKKRQGGLHIHRQRTRKPEKYSDLHTVKCMKFFNNTSKNSSEEPGGEGGRRHGERGTSGSASNNLYEYRYFNENTVSGIQCVGSDAKGRTCALLRNLTISRHTSTQLALHSRHKDETQDRGHTQNRRQTGTGTRKIPMQRRGQVTEHRTHTSTHIHTST